MTGFFAALQRGEVGLSGGLPHFAKVTSCALLTLVRSVA